MHGSIERDSLTLQPQNFSMLNISTTTNVISHKWVDRCWNDGLPSMVVSGLQSCVNPGKSFLYRFPLIDYISQSPLFCSKWLLLMVAEQLGLLEMRRLLVHSISAEGHEGEIQYASLFCVPISSNHGDLCDTWISVSLYIHVTNNTQAISLLFQPWWMFPVCVSNRSPLSITLPPQFPSRPRLSHVSGRRV
jgi:hypothetical protein